MVHFNQIGLQVHLNVALLDDLPKGIGEVFHAENNRQRGVVDDGRVRPLVAAPQIVFRDVADLLGRAGALDGRRGEGEHDVPALELLQRDQVPVHVLRRVDGRHVAVRHCERLRQPGDLEAGGVSGFRRPEHRHAPCRS